MRIAIAGIVHETNTYCKEPTRANEFYQLRGKRLLETRGQESDVGGAVDACERLGIEPVPLLYAGAQPSGTIDRVAYDTFKQEILDGLANNGVIDGVMLCLHGAGVVEGIQDLEGDLARAVRVQVGEAVPVVASFDLHGNITQDMADALDGVFACHHYPHIDLHKRSAEAVALIQRMLEENFRPVTHVASAPMLISFATTFLGPGKAKLAQILLAEEESGVIDVSWFHGFPYTDTVHVGTFVAVTTEGDREQARRIAEALAEGLWADRETFRPRSLSADEAVVAARLEAAKTVQPVVIHETSDNCGGGAPGDGTHLLRAMLDAKLDNACFGFLVDPEVASVCHEAGVGARLQISLGGKYDDLHGAPLELTAYVKSLHDGRIRMRAMFKGAPLNLGPMARLVVDGMDVIVASRRSQTFDIEPFLAVGIDVMNYDFVALKSSAHFRAGFQDLAGAIVTADPPGLTTLQIEVFPRERAPGPLWPVDG
ncbi:MAG: M81 family metallopeptidase [Pseudomonadales bacterium]